DAVRLSMQTKKIRLQTEIDPQMVQVAGDPNRIQQIMVNLLSNAVKFTPHSGSITVRLQQCDRCVHIQVQDTGKGITPEFMPYVFEQFRQADSTITRQFGGLGLGLSIVRHLCELHGGSVSVDSPGEDQGSTFTVCLPIQDGDQRLGARQQLKRVSTLATDLDELTVLVIDDDDDLRDWLVVALQEHGAEVLTVASARDGLQVLDQRCPDVIVCDIGMPDMNGYDLIRQLRQRSDHCRQIPAIALTAYAGDFNRQSALEAGFQQHLAKPVSLDRLRQAISTLVAAESQAPE
ncbi:hypothetical protein C7271_20005, partial [filamentous cyanobacterium CCP5]